MKTEITITITGNHIDEILRSVERTYTNFKTEQVLKPELKFIWRESNTPTIWEDPSERNFR